jgi:hypothetical protein
VHKIGIVSTTKAPLAELRNFVIYHLNIGIDYFVLFFDDPTDPGITAFISDKRIHSVACSEQYWANVQRTKPNSIEERQTINLNEGVKWLLTKDCSWILHLDSDELIHLRRPLAYTLSKSKADAIKLPIREAVPARERYNHIFEPNLFRKKPNQFQIRLARKLGCSHSFFQGEYFRAHTASKMIVRIAPTIAKYTIHNAEKSDGELLVEYTNSIELLHYDCIGLPNWKMKWDRRLDGSGRATQMRANRQSQLSLYREAKFSGERQLSLLYRRLYFISTRERLILYSIGLLKRINLRRALFNTKTCSRAPSNNI